MTTYTITHLSPEDETWGPVAKITIAFPDTNPDEHNETLTQAILDAIVARLDSMTTNNARHYAEDEGQSNA